MNAFCLLPRRALALLLALPLCASAEDTVPQPPAPQERNWPLWDGVESMESYAKRAGLEPQRTLDLGDGQTMELVLIPASEFIYGVPEPKRPGEVPWHGLAILAAGGLVIAMLIVRLLWHRFRRRERVQWSLRSMLVFMVAMGTCIGGWLYYRQATELNSMFEEAIRLYISCDPEKPVHYTLRRPYYLGQTEVSVQQYTLVCGKTKDASDDNQPATVSLNEALLFLDRLSAKTGRRLGLPTEPEWVFAAQEGSSVDWRKTDALVFELTSNYRYPMQFSPEPTTVKLPPEGNFRLAGMHQNQWEFCCHDDPQRTPLAAPTTSASYIQRFDVWTYDGPYNSQLKYRSLGAFKTDAVDFKIGPVSGFRVRCEP